MVPWFVATRTFTPADGTRWDDYILWSRLSQLKEVVSLDPLLCPTLLPEIRDDYWPYIVQEDFMLHYFLDFDFLVQQVAAIQKKNLLCVVRNPLRQPAPPAVADFEFLGYDLVDVQNGASALTNCNGFPDIFANSELSCVGLLLDRERAFVVQAQLRSKYPDEPHANCHVWAIFRAL